jgi:uncharacterized protein YfdQ (DUF2303 family)
MTEPISSSTVLDSKTHLTVAATYKDPTTGALYVHRELRAAQDAWSEEAHIRPMAANEQFGDIGSFVSYVQKYAQETTTHLTWNARGLRAVLDYADRGDGSPGRCQWRAEMPFQTSAQWRAWIALTTGQHNQRSAIERLEDLAADIVSPVPTDLMGLLRSLRATVNARADTELRQDGTTKVSFEQDTKVQTAKSVELPNTIAIAIPVLKGHVDVEGRPVLYRLDVRLRVSVDDGAKLTLRFAIPTADRVLEDVYADRVAAAKALLSESFDLLRASDS